jgi:hypothetical protein
MSNKQSGYINSFLDNSRKIFIGRPFELNRLVDSRKILILNQDECDQIIKAYNLYNGYTNLGLILSFSMLTLLIKVKMNIYVKIAVSFIPIVTLSFYSYFSYWDIIRDLVKETRKRSIENFPKESRLILMNSSDDYHTKIETQLGFYSSIKTTFNQLFNEI